MMTSLFQYHPNFELVYFKFLIIFNLIQIDLVISFKLEFIDYHLKYYKLSYHYYKAITNHSIHSNSLYQLLDPFLHHKEASYQRTYHFLPYFLTKKEQLKIEL